MSKFETFTGNVGASEGCLVAWNLPDVETGIALIHHDIGRNVLGRETCSHVELLLSLGLIILIVWLLS